MLLILETWLAATLGMLTVLALVIGVQAVARLLRHGSAGAPAQLPGDQSPGSGHSDLRLAS